MFWAARINCIWTLQSCPRATRIHKAAHLKVKGCSTDCLFLAFLCTDLLQWSKALCHCIVYSGAIFYGEDKFEVEVRNNMTIGRGNIEHPFKGNDPPTNERIVETSQGISIYLFICDGQCFGPHV